VFACFTTLASLGVALLLAVTFRESWTIRQLAGVSELQFKVAIEAAQQVSGFTGLFVTFAPTADKAQWQAAAFASFASCGVWKVVQLAVDWRQKRETARAVGTSESLSRLLVGIHNGVVRKLKRVHDSLKKPGKSPTSIVQVRETLTPTPHLDDLLEQLATVLQREVREVNVLAGVYVNRGGNMEPVHGVDLQNAGYNPFGSYKTHPAFYRVTGAKEVSHVVRCVVGKRTILVPDCSRASGEGEFYFSHPGQGGYLNSMVVYPLGEVYSGEKATETVVAVDANRAGFFGHADFDLIVGILKEFGLRIRLEMALQSFLGKREGSP